MTTRLPTYFISHGGGPWPFMPDRLDTTYRQLAAFLSDMPRQIGVTPKALLVITAHWEEHDFAVQAHPQPPMLYDYYGFPPHTYEVRYPAPGSPALAERVRGLIIGAGFQSHLDTERGFDHGTFTPLSVMYPQADVPVVQLSLRADFDPAAHIALGRREPRGKLGTFGNGRGHCVARRSKCGVAARDC
jgi:aromatic ring-opening dioxygenase catalytic subunit (LigB family)